jgi:hypothetical protein
MGQHPPRDSVALSDAKVQRSGRMAERGVTRSAASVGAALRCELRGTGEEVDEQLVDALGFVVMNPVRGVG